MEENVKKYDKEQSFKNEVLSLTPNALLPIKIVQLNN